MATTELDGSTVIEEGTVIDGKYRVRRLLAEGGMGRVYVADHVFLNKEVALKLLHPELSAQPDAAERFTVEARSASQIEHENIVRVSDFGRAPDGQLYLVMELLSGHTLADEIKRGALPPARARAIACAILRGLEAAHARGVIHRDLKPENVFITPKNDGSDSVKLLDFGIARMRPANGGDGDFDKRLTADGAIMGTPLYMAPEQLRGFRDVDARADLYAVGVLTYEMLSGAPPYNGETFGAIAHAVLEAKPRPLDSALGALVMRAFASDRERRFATAAELRRALEGVADVTASPYLAPRASQLGDLPLSATQERHAADATPRPRTVDRTRPQTMLPPTSEAALELDRPTPSPPPPGERAPRRGVGLALIAVALAVALGAVAAAHTLLSHATPPPAPTSVTVRVVEAPPAAHLFVDGAAAKATFTIAGDRAQHRLRLQAPGYVDKALVFVPDADQTIDGRMTRARE